MIIALTGSCCSSCCSTRNSRDRAAARVSDSLLPSAAEVVRPHAVVRLIPALTDSASPAVCAWLVWTLREWLVRASGSTLLSPPRPCPVAADTLSPLDRDFVTESVPPTVLVYEPVVVSVTHRPTVPVSCARRNRCSVR